MYYVIVIKNLSNGSQERTLNAYENKDTAIRKYHEAFNTVGGGPKRISSMLLRDVSAPEGISGLEVVATETWVEEQTEIVEPNE